jgi:murein DD-endopeptidase MepM/ murein hydrolase activator NlpD
VEKLGRGCTLAFFLVFLIPSLCPADTAGSRASGFPVIMRLDGRDTLFRQYMADVEASRGRIFNQGKIRKNPSVFMESLTIYRYTPSKGEDIFFLAARCNIPYAAIASLNRINHPAMVEAGRSLLLPSCPGIFVPAEPLSDLERLLVLARSPLDPDESVALTITPGGTDTETVFYFYPGAEFNATERAFFLNSGFRFPLRTFRLTSAYGLRQNPITGNIRLHRGLDMAAPEGTGVFAAADGIITEIGEDPVYGIYVVIKHGESWASLYGHLQKVETTLRSFVQSGTLIGRVGSTGQSTGPHLHFELRQNGKARDPDKYLFLPGG